MPLPGTAQRIRAAIAPAHARIEATPMARALAAGTFRRADYVTLHVQLQALHDRVEPRFARTPYVRPFYEGAPAQGRAPALRRDLEVLGAALPEANPRPMPATTALLGWVDAADGPALLGGLYVLEGSRLGARLLTPAVAGGLGVPPAPGHGLDYYLEGQDDVPRRWRGFLQRLDAAAFADEEVDGITAGARGLMERLCAVYAAVGA